jgi:hypothetical protein
MAALLIASREHNLHRVISYHHTIERAQRFAASLSQAASLWKADLAVEAHAVWGAQPSSTRTLLLDLLQEADNRRLTVVSNCRCLTEGVNVPALDGIGIIDPKQRPIEIVQALGRIMRIPPSHANPVGSVVVPLLLKDGENPHEALLGSEFRKLAQVIAALRAHDERLEARCANWVQERSAPQMSQKWFSILPHRVGPELLSAIETRVIMSGLGLMKPPLTREKVLEFADKYFALHGKYPGVESKPLEEMGDETWQRFHLALRFGHRGFPGGSSLYQLLVESGRKVAPLNLNEAAVLDYADIYFERFKEWPTAKSPALSEMGSDTWAKYNDALRNCHRGMTAGTTLHKFLIAHGRRAEKIKLSEEKIVEWAKAFQRIYGKLPNSKSPSIPEMGSECWNALNQNLHAGGRGFPGGSSLPAVFRKHGLK